MAAGPDCEVGVKRYAYCRRKLPFAPTFQRGRGEQVCSWPVSDEFGVKAVRLVGGIRGDSNKIIHYLLAITLIAEKELPPERKCCAD